MCSGSNKKKILVVGKNSLLAKRLKNISQNLNLHFISHTEIFQQNNFDLIDTIVNFAIDPKYFNNHYSEEIDFDYKLANLIKGTNIHYIMISSRAVYDKSKQWMPKEEVLLNGISTYGINKSITEKKIKKIITKENLTILRLSNIIGFEVSTGYKSFFIHLINSLKSTNEITYNISPFVKKDFITDFSFIELLEKIINERICGIFNIGSGIPIEIGYIALWVLEGFGGGCLKVTSPFIFDEFVLDVSKISTITGKTFTIDEIKDRCISLGKDLKK